MIKEAEKEVDYCLHPIKVQDNSEKGYYYKRCGARSELFCAYCSKVYTRDKNLIISSGCEVSAYDETITKEKLDKYSFYALTMTAPSFGAVYNMIDTYTLEDEDIIGTPKRFSAYKFEDHIQWNANSTELFHHSVKYLRKACKIDFDYVAVREWQARGVIHYHIIFRTEKEDSGKFIDHLKKFKTYKYNKDGKVYKWGQYSYISDLGKHTLSASVSYLSKALSSDVRQHGSEYKILPDRIRKFYDRLDQTAYDLLCKCGNDFTDCNCGVVRNFGFTGHLLSKSKDWSFSGLNMTVLKERRKEWVEENKDKMEEINSETSSYMEKIYNENVIAYSKIIGDSEIANERKGNLINAYKHIFVGM